MNEVLSSITNETSILIWPTNTSLKDQASSEIFAELDYLFNGLLSKHCKQTNNNQTKTFFSTKSFDKNIFLGHISSTNILEKEILSILNLVGNNEDKDIDIKIINNPKFDSNILKSLKKKRPNFIFSMLSPV